MSQQELTDRERQMMRDACLVRDYLETVLIRNSQLIDHARDQIRLRQKIEKRYESMKRKLAWRRKYPSIFMFIDAAHEWMPDKLKDKEAK